MLRFVKLFHIYLYTYRVQKTLECINYSGKGFDPDKISNKGEIASISIAEVRMGQLHEQLRQIWILAKDFNLNRLEEEMKFLSFHNMVFSTYEKKLINDASSWIQRISRNYLAFEDVYKRQYGIDKISDEDHQTFIAESYSILGNLEKIRTSDPSNKVSIDKMIEIIQPNDSGK